MRNLFAIAAIAFTFAYAAPGSVLANAAEIATDVPLPADVHVVPPGPAVPPDLAFWSGRWTGKWRGTLNTALVVETISGAHAQVVYGWGKGPAGRMVPGFMRATATVSANHLEFQSPTHSVSLRYTREANGKLAAAWQSMRGGYSTATMERVSQ